ncbi:hypothetical protein [Eubacterium aggregans]|uniref:hypothetical protein n=1 Tax=Eubacterium aggregans TaxID=81409 RepID=UPI003F3048C8
MSAEIVKEKVLPTDLLEKQDFSTAAGTTAGGMMLTVPVQVNDDGQITADTYSLSYDGEEGFVKTGTLVSTSKLFNPTATAYRNAYYVLAETNNTTEYKRGFAVDTQVKTLAQPGDTITDTVTPITPFTPVNPQGTNTILIGIQSSGMGILLGMIVAVIGVGGIGCLFYKNS